MTTFGDPEWRSGRDKGDRERPHNNTSTSSCNAQRHNSRRKGQSMSDTQRDKGSELGPESHRSLLTFTEEKGEQQDVS